MLTSDSLINAAIKFDERTLELSNDPGAAHFLGAMRVDPRHLGTESPAAKHLPAEIEVARDSLLFMAGEAVAAAVEGQAERAADTLSALEPRTALEKLLLLLLAAWLKTSRDGLSAIEDFITTAESIDSEIVVLCHIKCATWALDSFGISAAQPYYDKALENAAGDLARALRQVGDMFGREAFLYYPPPAGDNVTYRTITDRATEAVATFAVSKAKKAFNRFTRTAFADPATLPLQLRAAEMQAGWVGAPWLMQTVWRLKSAILLRDGKDAVEKADAIVGWILSDGSDLFRLVDENEQIFTPEIAQRILVDELQIGQRIDASKWVEICYAIWDQLPAVVSNSIIRDGPLSTSLSTDETTLREDGWVRLFANLSRIDSVAWVARFESLSNDERLAVATALDVRSAAVLPPDVKQEVRGLLFEFCSDSRTAPIAAGRTFMTLASLAHQSAPASQFRIQFQNILPRRLAARVAVEYPEFTRTDLIQEEQSRLENQIRTQIDYNRSGRWTSVGSDLSMSLAQTCIALKSVRPDIVELLVQYANAPFTAANDVIGSVQALSWLSDQGMLPQTYSDRDDTLTYRSDLSPVDRYWTGRDDLRAANAAIAGFYARVLNFDHEPVEQLIIAARDPDTQVRLLALQEFARMPSWLVRRTPALDAMVLGAVYDPESRAQSLAMDLLGLVEDDAVRRLAWERVISAWNTSHRSVRRSAARAAIRAKRAVQEASSHRGGHGPTTYDKILELARVDRSIEVRDLARV